MITILGLAEPSAEGSASYGYCTGRSPARNATKNSGGPLSSVAQTAAATMIPFKCNAGTVKGGLWEKMLLYFKLHREEFDARYHLQSNVESTFSMCKFNVQGKVRRLSAVETDVAMKNETLAKLVCHNVCCVIQAMHELGISPDLAQAG